MMEFKNLTKKQIRSAIFDKLYKKIFFKKKFELSVAIAPPKLMRLLNKKYRNKNKSADVLSFSLEKGLGEIFLNSEKPDLPYLFTHGALHLLGYGHETDREAGIMEKRERKLIK